MERRVQVVARACTCLCVQSEHRYEAKLDTNPFFQDYDYDLKAYMLDHDFIETIPKDENYQDRFDEYLQSFALEQRDELAGRMRRVLQRRDILSSIRRLGFSESWSMSNLLPSIGFTYAEYVAPVMPLLAGHIRSSSLSKLHFMTLYLYRSVWEAMAGSRSLHTATLYTAKAAEDEGAQWQVPFVLCLLVCLVDLLAQGRWPRV